MNKQGFLMVVKRWQRGCRAVMVVATCWWRWWLPQVVGDGDDFGRWWWWLQQVDGDDGCHKLVVMVVATSQWWWWWCWLMVMVVATSSSTPTLAHRLHIDHGIATTLRPAFSSFLCGRLPSPPSPPPTPPPSVRHNDALSHNFLFNFTTNFISLVFFTSSILLTGSRVGRRGGKMHVFIVFRTWLASWIVLSN